MIMKYRFGTFLLVFLTSSLLLTGCGSDSTPVEDDPLSKKLGEVMAAKTPFALAKGDTPVLSTYQWDEVFGGTAGESLKYDRFGEVDELVFMAAPNTLFNLQRQVRLKTRSGAETIYYKVTTPIYLGTENLWVDGRFLDLQDVRPAEAPETVTAAKTLVTLRSYVGIPYTWHGSSADGAPELLEYYPPAQEISDRSRSDWMLKGFDSLGMLYRASGGKTPVELSALPRFGEAVFTDLSSATTTDEAGNTVDPSIAKAKLLMVEVRPLDVITMGDRVWIVLDNSEVIESKYRSKFDGSAQTASLYDTLVGLFQKATFVKDPFEELENADAKRFFIRRYAVTENLLEEKLTEDAEVSTAKPEATTLPASDEETSATEAAGTAGP